MARDHRPVASAGRVVTSRTMLILTGVAALGVSSVFTELARRALCRWRIVDVPNSRSLHATERPRGGGVALVVAIPLVTIASSWGAGVPIDPRYWAVMALATVMAVVGFVDDIRRVPVAGRLIAQVSTAMVLVWLIGPVDQLVLPGVSTAIRAELGALLGTVLTVTAIVGFTNAFNFMDGIDGLAAAQALIGATLIAVVQPDAGGALVAAATAGAAGGFLVHNRPPARVFMGDAGSQYLGFLFGGLALTGDRISPVPASLIALAFLPFLVDAAATLIVRLVRGARVDEAHRDHAYQRFVLAGWSHARTTMVYAALGLAAAIGVLVVIRADSHGWVWWALATPTFVLVGSRLIRM